MWMAGLMERVVPWIHWIQQPHFHWLNGARITPQCRVGPLIVLITVNQAFTRTQIPAATQSLLPTEGSACAVFTAGSSPKFLCVCLMQGNQPGARWSHMGHGMHLPGPLLCVSVAAVTIGTSERKRAVLVPRQVELPLLLPCGPGMQVQNLHQTSGVIIVPITLI